MTRTGNIVKHSKQRLDHYDTDKPKPAVTNGEKGGRGRALSLDANGKAGMTRTAQDTRVAWVGEMVEAWEAAVASRDTAAQYGIILALAEGGAEGLAGVLERSMR
jgi:hypothetical protein